MPAPRILYESVLRRKETNRSIFRGWCGEMRCYSRAINVSKGFQYLFKTISIGDANCGKTALTVRYTQDIFKESYETTIGVNWASKQVDVFGQEVRLMIWDTGGQDAFVNVRSQYYKGASGILCVFDLTNRVSFEHVPKWLEETKAGGKQIPIVLVGNKSDLPDRQVSSEEAEAFADKHNISYVESSAKTGARVGDCFAILAGQILKEFLEAHPVESTPIAKQ